VQACSLESRFIKAITNYELKTKTSDLKADSRKLIAESHYDAGAIAEE
jgi:hypothetical protein